MDITGEPIKDPALPDSEICIESEEVEGPGLDEMLWQK